MKDKSPKIVRLEMGLRQIDLSLKTNIPTSKISLFENGLLKPRASEARKLNEALGVLVYKPNQENAL